MSAKSGTHLSLQDITYINLFSLSKQVKFGELRVILSYIISQYTTYIWAYTNKVFFIFSHIYMKNYISYFVASELKDPIWHSSEWQIGSFCSEATIFQWYIPVSACVSVWFSAEYTWHVCSIVTFYLLSITFLSFWYTPGEFAAFCCFISPSFVSPSCEWTKAYVDTNFPLDINLLWTGFCENIRGGGGVGERHSMKHYLSFPVTGSVWPWAFHHLLRSHGFCFRRKP